MGLLVGSWLSSQTTPSMFGEVFGACKEIVWRFEQRTFYFGSLRVQLSFICQEVLKFDPQ